MHITVVTRFSVFTCPCQQVNHGSLSTTHAYAVIYPFDCVSYCQHSADQKQSFDKCLRRRIIGAETGGDGGTCPPPIISLGGQHSECPPQCFAKLFICLVCLCIKIAITPVVKIGWPSWCRRHVNASRHVAVCWEGGWSQHCSLAESRIWANVFLESCGCYGKLQRQRGWGEGFYMAQNVVQCAECQWVQLSL